MMHLFKQLLFPFDLFVFKEYPGVVTLNLRLEIQRGKTTDAIKHNQTYNKVLEHLR